MLTFELAGTGYQILEDGAVRLDQPGDPRLPCIRPMILAPFASDAAATAHAQQMIVDMTPPEPAGV